MPVTIGTMNSTVNLVNDTEMPNEAVLEKIIQMAKARLKQEMNDEKQSQQEREVSDRVTPSDRL